MPSMSYSGGDFTNFTLFENTLDDLSKCIEMMQQAQTIKDMDMNEHEVQAFYAMWRVCREFLAEHERLLATDKEI